MIKPFGSDAPSFRINRIRKSNIFDIVSKQVVFLTGNKWAISSVVEHFLYTEGVVGPIPTLPTIGIIAKGVPKFRNENFIGEIWGRGATAEGKKNLL